MLRQHKQPVNHTHWLPQPRTVREVQGVRGRNKTQKGEDNGDIGRTNEKEKHQLVRIVSNIGVMQG